MFTKMNNIRFQLINCFQINFFQTFSDDLEKSETPSKTVLLAFQHRKRLLKRLSKNENVYQNDRFSKPYTILYILHTILWGNLLKT